MKSKVQRVLAVFLFQLVAVMTAASMEPVTSWSDLWELQRLGRPAIGWVLAGITIIVLGVVLAALAGLFIPGGFRVKGAFVSYIYGTTVATGVLFFWYGIIPEFTRFVTAIAFSGVIVIGAIVMAGKVGLTGFNIDFPGGG